MNRRIRSLERLFRLRSLERDAASALLAKAMLREREANAERVQGDSQVTRVEKEFQELLRGRPTAGFLRAGDSSRGRVRKIAAVASDAFARASRLTKQRREEVVGADQRARSIDMLMKRAHAEARRERLRGEQKRIDDSAGQRRGRWKRLSVLAVICFLSVSAGMDASADDSSRAPVDLATSFTAIRLRQVEQDQRERELLDRERNVESLERTALARLAELEELSELVKSRIDAWNEADGGKSISRLARVYGVMKPERAAQLVAGLDLELATQIVAKMKPKESSAVLGLLDRDRARKMSERIAHPLSMEPASATEELR